MTIVAISGGFDPVHCGHLNLIEEVVLHGQLIVILNSDAWLKRKKGYVFMTWENRARLLRALEDVHNVISVDDSDDTVCEALRALRPDYFANGGDRTSDNTPEKKLCEELGIRMLWNVGGGKLQSSSELVKNAR